jgi:hypothetical protein
MRNHRGLAGVPAEVFDEAGEMRAHPSIIEPPSAGCPTSRL